MLACAYALNIFQNQGKPRIMSEQLRPDSEFQGKMFAAVLRTGKDWGSQPLMVAMVTQGQENAMTNSQMIQIATAEGMCVFLKTIIKMNEKKTWEEILREFHGVERLAWDRFLEARVKAKVGGVLPNHPVRVDQNPITFHEFVTVATSMGFFKLPMTKKIIGLNEEGSGVIEGDQGDLENYDGFHPSTLGNLVNEMGIQEELDVIVENTMEVVAEEEEDKVRKDEGLEAEEEIDLEEWEIAPEMVKNHPSVKKLRTILKNKNFVIKELKQHISNQEKTIMRCENEIMEIKTTGAKVVVTELAPIFKNVVVSLKETNAQAQKSFEMKMSDLVVKTNQVMEAGMEEQRKKIKTLFDMSQALMGGMGTLIATVESRLPSNTSSRNPNPGLMGAGPMGGVNTLGHGQYTPLSLTRPVGPPPTVVRTPLSLARPGGPPPAAVVRTPISLTRPGGPPPAVVRTPVVETGSTRSTARSRLFASAEDELYRVQQQALSHGFGMVGHNVPGTSRPNVSGIPSTGCVYGTPAMGNNSLRATHSKDNIARMLRESREQEQQDQRRKWVPGGQKRQFED